MLDNTEAKNITGLMKKIGKEARSAQKHLAIAPADIIFASAGHVQIVTNFLAKK